MEYATNGSLGNTTTAYSFGVRRESFVETTAGMGAGATMGGMTYQTNGTYYYTGTGSVANVTGSATNQSYSYTTGGSMTAYAMNASATGASGSGITGASTLTTNPTAYGTYGVYGYNGEYTHTNLGLQYLRARYLNVATGTFTSRDTYAGRMQDILSQNRYTYAENNPVGHSDPSGHAVVKAGLRTVLKNLTNTIKNKVKETVREVKNIVSSTSIKFREVIKNYQSEKLLWTPISTIMSEKGLSYAESVAAKKEAALCRGYSYAVVNVQKEMIYEEIVVENGNDLFMINGTVTVIEHNSQTQEMEEHILHPAYNWGSAGMGAYNGQPMLDEKNRYRVAIGPKIINPGYEDSSTVDVSDYSHVESVTISIQNVETGIVEEKECVIVDLKSHTYNQYSDGHPEIESLKTYTVTADVESGLVQTAIAYPHSDNAKKDQAFSPNDISGIVIEFATDTLDFDPNEYRLKKIVVNTR